MAKNATPGLTDDSGKKRKIAGKRLDAAIRALGLTHREVSKATGLDYIAVTSLTTKTPHSGTLTRIAAYLESVARKR